MVGASARWCFLQWLIMYLTTFRKKKNILHTRCDRFVCQMRRLVFPCGKIHIFDSLIMNEQHVFVRFVRRREMKTFSLALIIIQISELKVNRWIYLRSAKHHYQFKNFMYFFFIANWIKWNSFMLCRHSALNRGGIFGMEIY